MLMTFLSFDFHCFLTLFQDDGDLKRAIDASLAGSEKTSMDDKEVISIDDSEGSKPMASTSSQEPLDLTGDDTPCKSSGVSLDVMSSSLLHLRCW